MSLPLIQKQKIFPYLVIKLLDWIKDNDFEVTLGEAWRPPNTAGKANSLHRIRLSIDLNLFKDGKYLTKTEQYAEAGEFWESLSTKKYRCVWGGRFEDGNHFSLSHGGVMKFSEGC